MSAPLELQSVSFGYRRKSPILECVSYRFQPGSVTAITGPSGRGKSTLLYIAGLLLQPSDGTVTLGSLSLTGLRDAERSMVRAKRFGFIFQDAALDPTRAVLTSVLEPALYAGRRRADAKRTALDLLDQFGVAHRANHRPGEISGGQAQRVAICRALVNGPDVILADEPTGNLDSDNANVVLSAFAKQASMGRTVVVATHDAQVVGSCDARLEL